MLLHSDRPSLLISIDDTTTNALIVLSVANVIYSELPDATLDIRVLNEPIVETKWAKSILGSSDSMSDMRESTLSCIAFFETGKSNVAPDQLRDVFAMASGNSIYMSEQVSAHQHFV